jgi:hypothetical protein
LNFNLLFDFCVCILQAFDWVYFVSGIDCGEFDGSASGCGSSWLLYQVYLSVEILLIFSENFLPRKLDLI